MKINTKITHQTRQGRERYIKINQECRHKNNGETPIKINGTLI